MPNENPKGITEEEQTKIDNEKFEELSKVPEAERTDEQKTEIVELKEKYGKRMQKKIDTMHAKQKELEEENEKIKFELDEIKKTSIKKDEEISESAKDETVEIGGKKYFTDKALIIQIKTKEITEEEAYAYQKKRDKEEIKADLRREHEEEETKKESVKLRKEDSDFVNKNYPHFNKKHSDFNPEDPLYKLSNELYIEAYAANPKGLSLAIKRAKEILRISDQHIDRSEDHDMEGSNPPERTLREKEITLTEDEKEVAVRQFTRGDVINPKTQRSYTVNEALAKALQGKKDKISRIRRI